MGESIEVVKKVMKALVHENYLEGMGSLLEWEILGVGMDISEGIESEEDEEIEKCVPFVKWPEGKHKAKWREGVAHGWEALKLIVELIEVEAVIVKAKVEVEWLEKLEQQPWRKKKMNETSMEIVVSSSSIAL